MGRLIVHSKNYNPLRASNLRDEIIKVCTERKLSTCGAVYIAQHDPQDPESDGPWSCHKCEAKNPKPDLTQAGKNKQGDREALGECPSCHYPFLFTEV